MDNSKNKKNSNIFILLRPYIWYIIMLVTLTIAGNGLNLVVPKIISSAIDSYTQNQFMLQGVIFEFSVVSFFIFILIYLQNIMQVYLSERVAKDIRSQLVAKIAEQDYDYIQKVTPSKLLTNLTSDADAVKGFVSQAIASIISSVFLIIGSSVLLISINWRLAGTVLLIVPVIVVSFSIIFSKARKLFKLSQETIDWLNKIINESILGSSLIRILNSQTYEYHKFLQANERARGISLSILKLFATLIPIIAFTSNIATLIILLLGGHYVITGNMSLGDFAAFNSYLSILIFPIIIIGFMSGVITQASASYARIQEVLSLEKRKDSGNIHQSLGGKIDLENVSLRFGEKTVLQNISFSISPHSKTAIIGPTAAGKTQLLYLLTGLVRPTGGSIKYDDEKLENYDKESFYKNTGLVFQDSNIFNLTLRENIAFSNTIDDASLEKAIETAELGGLISSLPEKLDTIVSERGESLSGGQKQRIMLARALAMDPKILFLDDFTARLDLKTEKKILENVYQNYPELTIISVTQKIEPIKDYDQIILIMEGEILAIGRHTELLASSLEYNQIYNSQFSTNNYEISA